MVVSALVCGPGSRVSATSTCVIARSDEWLRLYYNFWFTSTAMCRRILNFEIQVHNFITLLSFIVSKMLALFLDVSDLLSRKSFLLQSLLPRLPSLMFSDKPIFVDSLAKVIGRSNAKVWMRMLFLFKQLKLFVLICFSLVVKEDSCYNFIFFN